MIQSEVSPNISEFIIEKNPVNFYIDLDINKVAYPREFTEHVTIAKDVIEQLILFFNNLGLKVRVIALKSHGISRRNAVLCNMLCCT